MDQIPRAGVCRSHRPVPMVLLFPVHVLRAHNRLCHTHPISLPDSVSMGIAQLARTVTMPAPVRMPASAVNAVVGPGRVHRGLHDVSYTMHAGGTLCYTYYTYSTFNYALYALYLCCNIEQRKDIAKLLKLSFPIPNSGAPSSHCLIFSSRHLAALYRLYTARYSAVRYHYLRGE